MSDPLIVLNPSQVKKSGREVLSEQGLSDSELVAKVRGRVALIRARLTGVRAGVRADQYQNQILVTSSR
jgi:hypothetical protein